MKIALVGPTYPHRGGIAHYTALLADHLSEKHAVRVYGFREQYPSWLFPGRGQLDPSPTPVSEADKRRWLVPWRPDTWAQVKRDWRQWRPELIVLQWWVPFMAVMTASLVSAACRLGIPAVAICHNVLPHERTRLDRLLVKTALTRTVGLVVHSAQDQQVAQTLLPGHPVKVAAMPRYELHAPATPSRIQARRALALHGPTVLFFGFVRPYKGLFDLLDAMPTVVNACQATLLVVGEIWGAAEPYLARVRQLGLSENVRFVNRYVTNAEAAGYFAAADLVVLPYRSATGSAATQLALAFGVPVVATRVGSLAEAIQDGVTGFLVAPGDVAGLAEAIERFFREERAAGFRAAIEQQHREFTWDNIAHSLLELVK